VPACCYCCKLCCHEITSALASVYPAGRGPSGPARLGRRGSRCSAPQPPAQQTQQAQQAQQGAVRQAVAGQPCKRRGRAPACFASQHTCRPPSGRCARGWIVSTCRSLPATSQCPQAHQVVRVLRPHGVRVVHNHGDGLPLSQALWAESMTQRPWQAGSAHASRRGSGRAASSTAQQL